MSLVIRSRDNALVKRLARLSAQGRARREEGVGIIEGWHLVRALLESRRRGASNLLSVALSEAAIDHPESRTMIDRLDGVALHVIEASVFARIGESDGPNAVPLKHMKALLGQLARLDRVVKEQDFLEDSIGRFGAA